MRNRLLRFVKDWTLPVAMVLGAGIYMLFATLPALDAAGDFFAPLMDASLPLFMFFVLFVTFCKVDFHKMRPVRWHLWVTVCNLLLVGTIMTVILVADTSSAPLLVHLEALLMCVIAPAASAAAVVTQKLGGSLEQMTTYTFMSNFLTALLVPLCFPLIERSADVTFMAAFTRIFYQMLTLLVLPMLLAYVVKHRLHRLHQRIIAVRDLSFYLWACLLMVVTGVTLKNIRHADASAGMLAVIALSGLAVCILQFAIGRAVGRCYGRAQEAGQALGQKNTSMAIWMSITYLNPLSSVGPGCYILWQNIINSLEIWQHRRSETVDAGTAADAVAEECEVAAQRVVGEDLG